MSEIERAPEASIKTCGFPYIFVGTVNSEKAEVPVASVSDAVDYLTQLDYQIGKVGGAYKLLLLAPNGKIIMNAVRLVTKSKGAVEAPK